MRAFIKFVTSTGRVIIYLHKLDAEILGGTLPPLPPAALQKLVRELLEDPTAVWKRRAAERAAEEVYDRAHRRVPSIVFWSPDGSPLPLEDYDQDDLIFQYELDAPRGRTAPKPPYTSPGPEQTRTAEPKAAALQKNLQTPRPAVALFITLSAPPGVSLDRATWLQVFITVLDELALPFRALPWITSRHTDTAQDHLHGLVLLRTFDGREVEVTTSPAMSERIHKLLCERLGLPAPVYFDPKVPGLVSVTPARRVRRNSHKQELLRDLNASMKLGPTDLEELDQLMARQPGEFVRRLAVNNGDNLSSHWSRPGWTGTFGRGLGTAYEPRHLAARFRLAARLRALSPMLDLAQVVQSLVAHEAALPPDAPRLEMPHDDDAHPALLPRDPRPAARATQQRADARPERQPDHPDRDPGHAVATHAPCGHPGSAGGPGDAGAPLQRVARSDAEARQERARTGDDRDGSPGGLGRARAVDGGTGELPPGPRPAGGGSLEPEGAGREHTPDDRRNARDLHREPPSLGGWLTRVIVAARRHGGALLRLLTSRRGEPVAHLGFADGGRLLVAPSGVATRQASPQAEACRATLEAAKVTAARPIAGERPSGYRESSVHDAGTPALAEVAESPQPTVEPSWSDMEFP